MIIVFSVPIWSGAHQLMYEAPEHGIYDDGPKTW